MTAKKENIVKSPSPSLIGKPEVLFIKSDYDAVIWQKGYRVLWEKAIRCPCKVRGSDNLTSCLNCGGSGWLWVDPIETRMVLQSMNYATKFKDWSEENIGTVRITARDVDRVGFMDRITVLDTDTVFSENIYPIYRQDELIAKSFYKIKEMLNIYAFLRDNERLIPLTDKEYSFENDVLKFDTKFSSLENFRVSLRYKHQLQFYIIDLTRDTMVTTIRTEDIKNEKETVLMPISAIGRRSHFVLDVTNFNGDILFDNTVR